MASIVVAGDVSGTVTLSAPSTAGTTTLTLPTTSGTVLTSASSQVTGPAFSAYLSATQSITSGTFTKMQFNTEEYDTNNNYDTTNYRFTPTVAGYYQVNGRFDSTVASTLLICTIYKNGSESRRGVDTRASLNAASGVNVSAVIYMNGTTDYLELYAYIAGTSPGIEGASPTTSYFQAFLARVA